MTGLTLPLVLLAASAGIDFQRWGGQKSRLQEFADTLALKGAREFMLANAQVSQVESVILAIAASDLPDQLHVGEFTINVSVDDEDASVTVNLSQPPEKTLLLSHFSPYGDEVEVHSTAVARGGMNVCVVALQDSGTGAIATDNDAVLDATPCSILSNSTSSSGISALAQSELKAGLICSAGGASGSSANFTPSPTNDCPAYPDPLAQRSAPPVGSCDYNNFQVGYILNQGVSQEGGGGLLGGLYETIAGTVESVADLAGVPLIEQTLEPGVYCGGLKIKMKARVTFQPGIYVIKNGPLDVGIQSTLEGENIAFHLTGDNAVFTFDKDAKVTMSAPKTGPLAGILFYEDRDAPMGRVHSIFSEDARRFLGTFYLPRGTLLVDTETPVADTSAYTAIVVRKLDLKGAPTLVLNADYSSTDVPVPPGVGPVGGEVYLRD